MSAVALNRTMTEVRKFIEEELISGRIEKFDDGTDLIEQGVIDSLSLIRLVTFLEQVCQIQVPDEEIVPNNFRSVSAIQAFVAGQESAKAHQGN